MGRVEPQWRHGTRDAANPISASDRGVGGGPPRTSSSRAASFARSTMTDVYHDPCHQLGGWTPKEVVAGLAVQTTDPASRRGTSSTNLRSHWNRRPWWNAPPPPKVSDAVTHERFNLHASVHLAANDAVGRERLCRYPRAAPSVTRARGAGASSSPRRRVHVDAAGAARARGDGRGQQRPGLRMTRATAARPSSSTSSRVSRALR